MATIYLPLTRLLNLYVVRDAEPAQGVGRVPRHVVAEGAVHHRRRRQRRRRQEHVRPHPAGAAGAWPDHPKVDLVTTDGFLYPNKVLDDRGIMNRKGFPESYDTRRLLQFLRDVEERRGRRSHAPVYSHVVYDIIDGETVDVSQPDIVILEGLNVLQVGRPSEAATEFVSDYFDFSIYIDADETHIEEWYVQRFMKLRDTVFQNPDSFFRHFADLSHDEAIETAKFIWHDINGKNLRENIAPTKSRAALLLRKGADHRVTEVSLRRL